ncbi:MAG: alpha-glucan family phosphorylase [Planctomycetes bacterium]|nr:alpha-glucan family phosphorylase [Planctomycetota bacterium]
MRPIHTFPVIPRVPESLSSLRRLAYNLWWCWNPEAIQLFRRLDPDLWEETYHNPVKMLGLVSQERLYDMASDAGFKAHLNRCVSLLERYLAEDRWHQRIASPGAKESIAYFSLEFGLTESMPIYSGGLGILAGDHLKSASDLGIPLVAVGLLYQRGYFQQYLNADGWQQERYPVNDFYNMAIEPAAGPGGSQLVIEVAYPGRVVQARVWVAQVGRVPLYLLDTNLPANGPGDRSITGELYGGDMETRIQQELLLGLGGVRALHMLGIDPIVCHMNEGHSAFLGLERIRLLMEAHGVSFWEAWEVVAGGTIFTTHTPVPAGIDIFPPDLMDRYFHEYYGRLGLTREQFLGLGQEHPGGGFSMAVLGLRLSTQTNAVSRLHSRVSRKMWSHLWSGLPLDEVPIKYVTNGVHYRSWISKEMVDLYDRYLGTDWQDDPAAEHLWKRIEDIPDQELWRTHERRRDKLIGFARARLRAQLERQGVSQLEVRQSAEVLDPRALTIGFARRFATYKRATLLFKDADRLARLVNDPERPLQLVFAGKAHPRDVAGKELIRHIVHISRRSEFRNRIVFIEDYDICVARYIVQGVDLWLNTPRRPLEASGTSGMKASANGVLNLSILDGWWDEAYTNQCGWAIGSGEEYSDEGYQDMVESQALYDLLEREIVPLFYRRDSSRLPRGWISLMKSALRRICPTFNTSRMVRQYYEEFYKPGAALYRYLSEDGMRRARSVARLEVKVRERWSQVRIRGVSHDYVDGAKLCVGDQLRVRAEVDLSGLEPQEVTVEIYHGVVDPRGDFHDGQKTPMQVVSQADGRTLFEGTIPCAMSGLYGYSVRIMPRHPDLAEPRNMGLIHWAPGWGSG